MIQILPTSVWCGGGGGGGEGWGHKLAPHHTNICKFSQPNGAIISSNALDVSL